MSKINLSSQLAHQLEQTLKEARRLREMNDVNAASQKYALCASLQTRLAEFAVNAAALESQLLVAKTYADTARQLQQTSEVSRQDKQQDKQSGRDEYQQQIQALVTRAKTTWDDIGNLVECKQAIQSAYALALVKRPTNVKRGYVDKILLYGPPGTGKTMLAAAASNELEAHFYNVKVSEIVSKWFGESSRLLSALYQEAASQSPAVIFLEEFDALAPARTSNDSGAERRIVSTLLAELDGLQRHVDSAPYVLTIAATNLPWAIDKPILERFGARLVYVPLPEDGARAEILNKGISAKGYSLDYSMGELVARTRGYSGRDTANLCDIAIECMEIEYNPGILNLSKDKLQDFELRIQPIKRHHFEYAFQQVIPVTTADDVTRFEQWRNEMLSR